MIGTGEGDPERVRRFAQGMRPSPEGSRHRPTPTAPRRPTMRPGDTVRGDRRTLPGLALLHPVGTPSLFIATTGTQLD